MRKPIVTAFLGAMMVALVVVNLAKASPAHTTPNVKVLTRAYMNYLRPGSYNKIDLNIRCATSMREWHKIVSNYGKQWRGVHGITRIRGNLVIIRMQPWVCQEIKGGPYARWNDIGFSFGSALYVLTHEATHAVGYTNEADTSCMALRWGPSFLTNRFWTHRQNIINKVQTQALEYYSYQPAKYLASCTR